MAPWQRHLRIMLATFAGLVAFAALLVWIGNPYGNLPGAPLSHVLMDDNQRYQFPAVVRSGRYDSLVIGTSTGRLLEPKRLEAIFGGRFANLALNSGTAWEQTRMARFLQRVVARPGTLVVALDHVWCLPDADTNRITRSGFPEWLYDEDPWNDISHMLNLRSVEISARRIGHALGLVRERWPHNGYEVFVPPESKYDLERARRHIWGPSGQPSSLAVSPLPFEQSLDLQWGAPFPLTDFPALTWLEKLIDANQGWRRVVLLITPVHRASRPVPNTGVHAREVACKAHMAVIARRHKVILVDFRISSAITENDANYWDPLHYRVPIAGRIVDRLAQALATGRDDSEGDFRLLSLPSRPVGADLSR